MAEAYAKATGKPGVLLVTRGPGITHASIALHTAQQDSTPLVTFVGQVPTATRYREGFQEMDLTEFARPMTKWAVELTDPATAPRLIAEAFTRASIGRPGPVPRQLARKRGPGCDRRAAPSASDGPAPCAKSRRDRRGCRSACSGRLGGADRGARSPAIRGH